VAPPLSLDAPRRPTSPDRPQILWPEFWPARPYMQHRRNHKPTAPTDPSPQTTGPPPKLLKGRRLDPFLPPFKAATLSARRDIPPSAVSNPGPPGPAFFSEVLALHLHELKFALPVEFPGFAPNAIERCWCGRLQGNSPFPR